MTMAETYAESITLKTPEGGWLGQIVLTSNGMFASVTDWGNYSYAWRGYTGTFKEFLLQVNEGYFADKMVQGFAYQRTPTKDDKRSAKQFAEKILPALQEHLRKEIAVHQQTEVAEKP